MRLRNVKNAEEILENCSFLITESQKYKGKFHKLFNNDNPICLEIGMGKGSFLIKKAINNPNINFIGIEKMSSILARAIQNITPHNLKNIKVIRCDALELDAIFNKEIDTIYLNFSDPWPKSRHAKRRLTSPIFLNIYEKIFKDKKTILLKTDNTLLFESSIVSLSTFGYIIKDISLHNSDKVYKTTEYEEKFCQLNVKINYLKAEKE